MSLDWLLTDKLGIPFLGKTGLICVSCGGAHYYIAMHHGVGSGKRRGSKTNNTEDLAVLMPGADIYLEGHTHSYDFFINEQRYIDRKRGHDVRFPAYFCVTGHFLKYDDSYAEDFKLRPMPQGAAMLKLFYARSGNFGRKKVKCDLFQ